MAAVLRATGGTMLNRVCAFLVRLSILSMLVVTMGAAGCSGGQGPHLGTTGGTISTTAGTTVPQEGALGFPEV
jgi:hypothetical protein